MATLQTRFTHGADSIDQDSKSTLDSFQRQIWQASRTNLGYRDFEAAFGQAIREMYFPVPIDEQKQATIRTVIAEVAS